jgi:hypothetical protein
MAPLGEVKLPGHRNLMESLTAFVPELLNITYGKSFLPGDAYPMAESSRPLGVYTWYSYVRRQWDEFHTQVHSIRCAWVPTTTSLHVRCLRLSLLEARSS